MRNSITHARVFALVFSVLTCAHAASAQPVAATPGPGSTYAALQPQQQRLVEDWFKRFSALVGKPADPVEGYEALPISTRTTFNAVTHALLKTTLTDESGKSLGESAIELVDKVDTVAGAILGAGSDQQFRLYVQLKPGAFALLSQAKEFYRAHDNTVYHKGYPTSFRSDAGTPSIQFSLTRDSSRADIDVDYRSSKFPLALINGHLTASNSDIRAGNNDARHNNQWTGLSNWWRNLLGLPFAESPNTATRQAIAAEPSRKADKPADAVYDFLNGWLVEQKPDQAIGYFTTQAVTCAESEGNVTADHGMMKFAILQRMIAANAELGKVAALSDISLGVAIASDRAKVIKQPYHAQFVLYDVREDLAEELNCANRLDATQMSAAAMKSRAFGKYVGALFTIKNKNQTGRMVATLWKRERGYWRLISYDIDPEIDRSRAPNVGAKIADDAPLESVAGDQEMISAASSFLNEWMVKKNIDKAIEYVAPRCLACVNLYRADDVPAPSTPEESRALLKKGMAGTATTVGAARNLASAIAPPNVHHQALKLVKHRDDAAFVIAAVPESMGDAADCERRRPNGDPEFSAAAATVYGKYYASGFALRTSSASPATLWIIWSKVDGSWKAVSYVLLTP